MKNKKIITLSTIFIVLTLSIMLSTSASALVLDSVQTIPLEIAPGESAVIELVVENDLNKDVEDLSISLDLSSELLPFAPFGKGISKFLDELDEDDSEKFNFEIIASPDAELGIYKIPVKMKYKEKNEEEFKEEESLIGIAINSEAELGINLKKPYLIKGKKEKILVEVINKGLSKVKFLEMSVSIDNLKGIKFLSQTNKYIGDIDSDDFDDAEFELIANENAPSQTNLVVLLKYRDSSNKEFIKTETLNLRLYSNEEAIKLELISQDNTVLYVCIVAILIVAFIIYKVIKRRKLKRAIKR